MALEITIICITVCILAEKYVTYRENKQKRDKNIK